MGQYLPALTGLRFVAAFSVIFSHSLLWVYRFEDHGAAFLFFSNLSGFGMTLFFVLSGFVIHHNYANVVTAKGGLRKFFVARFARLYPLYLLALAIEMAVRHLRIDQLIALPSYLTLTQTWLYLPVLGRPLASQFGAMTDVSWSISTEVFFYFAFPLLCVLITKLSPARAIAVLCTLSISAMVLAGIYRSEMDSFGLAIWGDVGGAWLTGFNRWLLYFSPYSRILEFVLGMLVSAMVHQLPKPASQSNGAIVFLAAIVGCAALQWEMFGMQGAPWPLMVLHLNFGFAPFVALIIFVCARHENTGTRLLSIPPIVLLGEASYSMYLIHPIIIGVVQLQIKNYGGSEILQLLGCLITVAGISIVSWRWIEMPARRFTRDRLDNLIKPVSRMA